MDKPGGYICVEGWAKGRHVTVVANETAELLSVTEYADL